MNRIITLQEEVPNVYKLVVEAPDVARRCKAGQFAVVIPDEKSERIPLSISDWDPEAGTVTLYFLEVGVSTMKLARRKEGEEIDFMGPLGRPADIENYGTVFIGGGCYGVGAILPIVKALKAAGNRVVTAIEGRSHWLLYNKEELIKHSDRFLRATSDGSEGTKGKVRNVLDEQVDLGEKFDIAFFFGCTFMMMKSSKRAKELNIPCRVYLNPIMVDATGMCGVCRVNVDGMVKFACVDGPEFDGALVDWPLLFKRNRQYVAHETLAFQHNKCELHHHAAGDDGGGQCD